MCVPRGCPNWSSFFAQKPDVAEMTNIWVVKMYASMHFFDTDWNQLQIVQLPPLITKWYMKDDLAGGCGQKDAF